MQKQAKRKQRSFKFDGSAIEKAKENRQDGESVEAFLDRTQGINRPKYTATYNPRFGRYGY